ncbi:Pyrophosphate-energized vacuolar membrane proton pump [Bienertia sinuspersici]
MLPYWFSAMTMKNVNSATLKMVKEVRKQFNTIPSLMERTAKPDYATCVNISTDASIKERCPGYVYPSHPRNFLWCRDPIWCSGWVAISASNTGGAWDNAKKYIEAGAYEHARTLGLKSSEPHKAVVIGDTIGDPLKDTSGPSLNILIKLMAVKSLFLLHSSQLMEVYCSRSFNRNAENDINEKINYRAFLPSFVGKTEVSLQADLPWMRVVIDGSDGGGGSGGA